MDESASRPTLDQFIKVTKTYYLVNEYEEDGGWKREYVPYKSSELNEEFSKEERKKIKYYNGFTVIASHVNYQYAKNGLFNIYGPLCYSPQEGKCEHILGLVRQIFGDQYELGLDYLQLMYLIPKTRLPVLLLISKTQGTGKTTFLNLLQEIYQSNVTKITSSDFRNRFNLDWAGKLLLLIDEALLDQKRDYEIIKERSSARTVNIEGKNMNRFPLEFFAKFILCSNNINRPVYVEKNDERFWVRKVPDLKKKDPNFEKKMKKEIPAFLYFLKNRELSVPKKAGRFWFKRSDYMTNELKQIIDNCLNPIEDELFDFFSHLMTDFGIQDYKFSVSQLMELMKREKIEMKSDRIKRILKSWGMSSKNSSYKTLVFDEKTKDIVWSNTICGWYYTMTEQKLKEIK